MSREIPPSGRRTNGRLRKTESIYVRRDCQTGKICWESKSAAKRSLKRTERGGVAMTAVYKCSMCGAWHVTSQEQR